MHRSGRQALVIVAIVIGLAPVRAYGQATAPSQPEPRDPLWNGALIGLAAGLGSTAALDAVFCDNGFGGCRFPWRATFLLGGIGAAAGAGIDLLIGRRSARQQPALRVMPILESRRRGVLLSLRLPGHRPRPWVSDAAPQSLPR